MKRSTSQAALVVILLVAAVAAVFSPLDSAGFLSDDDHYAKENPDVRAGLTATGALRAFTRTVSANWHPLTMLSLMLDAELFGSGPRGFHLMNVFYHACGAVLAFLVLRRLTGAPGRSAIAAALFALHPLHVESVAWISERKDVLSGVFFWLALAAYGHYAERPSARRHLLVGVLLAAGLLAKPMLVTLPLLLLVLDAWPLGRLGKSRGNLPVLVREKLPWLALSLAAAVTTLVTQARGQALQTVENLPLAWRIQNALLSYARYLRKAVWPEGLHFLHPYPTHAPGIGPALGALVLVVALTLLAYGLRRRHPACAAGWLWYLGLLVPVIGLVQVGSQTHADRYTYLPLTGAALAAIWPLADLLRGSPARRAAGAVAAAAVIGAWAALSHAQARHWESGLTLYARTLAVGSESEKWLAHYGLGVASAESGDLARAARHYRMSIELRPAWAGSHNNLASTFLKMGQPGEALAEFREAVRLAPADARGHYGAGLALAALGRDEEAIGSFREALRLDPGLEMIQTDLGGALARTGRLREAESAFREAIRLRPEDPLPPYNLGLALAALGRQEEAVLAFRAALRLRPDFADASNDLGVSLAALGRDGEALTAFETAVRLNPSLTAARDNLSRARKGLASPGHVPPRAALR